MSDRAPHLGSIADCSCGGRAPDDHDLHCGEPDEVEPIIDPFAKCCRCGLFCLAVLLPDGRRCCHECYGKVARKESHS